MFSEPNESVLPPSPEAVQSIGETIDLIDKGDRNEAGRLLERYFEMVSPTMMAFQQLLFMSKLLSDKEEVRDPLSRMHPNPMEYDWIYYADAALKLHLVEFVTDKDMLDAIEMVRTRKPPMAISPELNAHYNRYPYSAKKQGQRQSL